MFFHLLSIRYIIYSYNIKIIKMNQFYEHLFRTFLEKTQIKRDATLLVYTFKRYIPIVAYRYTICLN